MDAIFGHNVAEEIRTRKLMVPELKQKETRFHPELPDVEEHRQFLTLVEDAEEEENCEEIDRLFKAVDKDQDDESDSDSSSAPKKKKRKESKEEKSHDAEPEEDKPAKSPEKKASKKDKNNKKEKKEKKNKREENAKPETEEEKQEREKKEAAAKLQKEAKKAVSDASSKIKWAIGLEPNIAHLYSPKSEKFAASVKADVDEKKHATEVLSEQIRDLDASRKELEIACEPLKKKGETDAGPFERDVTEKLASGDPRRGISRYFGLSEQASRFLTQSEADDIERAGKAYLLAYRQLNHMSIRSRKLAWVLVPKWHVMSHVLKHDVQARRCNPRFYHTFCDEDGMMVLKKWARRADPKHRENGIMRIARLRMKTLSWRLRHVNQKRKR
ncbi:unnamed protein product [Cladocopium goreaui]|uniref:Uncharacterized protein n=1 Tax=Cladocopium goreaui TaxID=2562237 RepID=A0A9P1GQ26_9DINO|nr:unnamed protein product [Cladocopium goreaui]